MKKAGMKSLALALVFFTLVWAFSAFAVEIDPESFEPSVGKLRVNATVYDENGKKFDSIKKGNEVMVVGIYGDKAVIEGAYNDTGETVYGFIKLNTLNCTLSSPRMGITLRKAVVYTTKNKKTKSTIKADEGVFVYAIKGDYLFVKEDGKSYHLRTKDVDISSIG